MTPAPGDPLSVNQHVIRRENPGDPTLQARYRCDNCGATCKVPSGFYHIECGGSEP